MHPPNFVEVLTPAGQNVTDLEMGFKEAIELDEVRLLGSLEEEEMRTRTRTRGTDTWGHGRGCQPHAPGSSAGATCLLPARPWTSSLQTMRDKFLSCESPVRGTSSRQPRPTNTLVASFTLLSRQHPAIMPLLKSLIKKSKIYMRAHGRLRGGASPGTCGPVRGSADPAPPSPAARPDRSPPQRPLQQRAKRAGRRLCSALSWRAARDARAPDDGQAPGRPLVATRTHGGWSVVATGR